VFGRRETGVVKKRMLRVQSWKVAEDGSEEVVSSDRTYNSHLSRVEGDDVR
jgi:hypothetical protein